MGENHIQQPRAGKSDHYSLRKILQQLFICVLFLPLEVPVLSIIDEIYISVYRKTSNISRTFVGNKIVDHSDVVGAWPVGGAPTTFSFST